MTNQEPRIRPSLPSSIQVENLGKEYGKLAAVDQVSLEVNKGEIFGFLGPNGAGKTTTIKMIAGLLQPDHGSIHIQGIELAKEPLKCKQAVGYIPDRPYLYEKLTGMEFLHFMASLYDMAEESFDSRVSALLELMDLTDWVHHLIESYSHGMRQKLIIVAAFMFEPPIILVDEPMVGLDPKSAKLVKELFKNHAAKGNCVFLSTHSLEIAEELCDRIAIIMNGKIRIIGTLDALRQEAGKADSGLEDIFLELTGTMELQEVIAALRRSTNV